jgi:hypothetical protein
MGARLALGPRASLRRGLLLMVAAAGPLLAARDARADGAFPDSLSILTPAQLPNETLLATNFGLVMSFDRDQTWIWSCEQPLNSFGILYQMGPPPKNRIFAIAAGLIYSDDSSCTWTAAGGAATAADAFADPTNPNRVLAVVTSTVGDAGAVYTVVESSDAGTTFPQLRYTAAAGDHITGVEISRSDPQTVYLTLTSGTAYTPKVAVTNDGGISWTLHDLTTSLPAGTYSIRLVAVDPTNPQTLFLRIGSTGSQSLAVSQNGGASATTPLTFPAGAFNVFTRLDSGSLIAGGVVGTANVAYRSVNGGTSFDPLPAVPFTFNGLSARGTRLYAALENMTDLYAIETSDDEGMSWQPLMRFNQDVDAGATGYIQAVQTCVMSFCQDDCNTRAGADLFSQDVCSATVAPDPLDGGTGGTAPGSGSGGSGGTHPTTGGGGQASGTGGTSGAGGSGGSPSSSSGCHCALSPGAPTSPLARGALLVAAFALCLRRRRRDRPSIYRPR